MRNFNFWFFSRRLNKYVFDFKRARWAYNQIKLKILKREMKDDDS